MKNTLISALSATALLVGCTGGVGSEYVGKWVDVKSERHTLVIERNGDGFIVRNTMPSFLTGQVETQNIPATLKEGTLMVQGGGDALAMMVDKSSGNLTSGQAEFKRVK